MSGVPRGASRAGAVVKRRPGKINHKRRMTDAQKERAKQERWEQKKALPRIEIAPGLILVDENFGVTPIKLPPENDPYGLGE